MPSLDWLRELADIHGYEVVPPGPGVQIKSSWRVVSWLLIDRHLDPRPVSEDTWTLFAVHESYAAAATVTWPELGEITVVSMHASPRPVSSA